MYDEGIIGEHYFAGAFEEEVGGGRLHFFLIFIIN